MKQALSVLLVAAVDHAKEFFLAIARQADLPSSWPPLILLVLSIWGALILAAQLFIVKVFNIPPIMPIWLNQVSIFCAIYLIVIVVFVINRKRFVVASLARYARELDEGNSEADKALMAEVLSQATAMNIRRTPDIFVIYPGDHPLTYAACAHAGFIDKGRVAIHEYLLNEYNIQELRMIIRHELAHIKNRDGLVRAVLDVFKVVIDASAMWVLKYLYAIGLFVLCATIALYTITYIYGEPDAGGFPIVLGRLSGIIVMVYVVMAAVASYVYWACRCQEFKADEIAATGIDRKSVQNGVELIELLEGDNANPPKGMLPLLRWRLLRTHPTPTEREARLKRLGLL